MSDVFKHVKYFVAESKSVSVTEDSTGNKLVEVPIQSLSTDRDGDVISQKGQESILRQLRSGLVPAFPNHGFGDYAARYDFRDIMGNWVGGRIDGEVTRATLRLRKNNDAAAQVLDLVEQGMPLGFSIGFIVLNYDEDAHGLIVNELDLLEISPVGIPSNPLAVVGYDAGRVALAVKSAINNKVGVVGMSEEVEKSKVSEDVSEVKSEEECKVSEELSEPVKACDNEEDSKEAEDESDEEDDKSDEEDDKSKEAEDEKEEEEKSEKESDEDVEESKKEDEEDDKKSVEVSDLKVLMDKVASLENLVAELKSSKVEAKEVKSEVVPRKIKTVKKEEVVEEKSKSEDDLIIGYDVTY